MDFAEVVRRRKMVRTFSDDPVAPDALDRILDRARRAPSAGYSQGFAFLVLDRPEDVASFWRAAREGGGEEMQGWPGEGLRRAPVLVIPVAGKHVYLDRYAEEDKGWADRAEARWPVPYWLVDTAFASMVVLLAAVDEGLGALFFGLYREGYTEVGRAFGIPAEWEPIGVIALGHSASVDPVRSSAHTRPRRERGEVVHRGRW
jgi:nitroreductase